MRRVYDDLPLNHPWRHFYRSLAVLIGLALLGFGATGLGGASAVPGFATNLAFAVMVLVLGLALLVVLDTLSPAERLAFVLHDMFELPFEEIAPLVGRSPATARQLASRARRSALSRSLDSAGSRACQLACKKLQLPRKRRKKLQEHRRVKIGGATPTAAGPLPTPRTGPSTSCSSWPRKAACGTRPQTSIAAPPPAAR